jgi:hypothetical protein
VGVRFGITEVSLARPHPVLVLASEAGEAPGDDSIEPAVDLSLSFDQGNPLRFEDATGRYRAERSPDLARSGRPWTRAGEGAARFSGAAVSGASGEGPLVLRPKQEALFAPGKMIGDFSIEFWLFPMNMESGEQILAWTAAKPDGSGAYTTQRIQCEVVKNRLRWTFLDFFSVPGRKTVSLTGSVVLPQVWSHHLLRFNADLGLLEYLVNGRLEALEYTTSSGREGGDVCVPEIGGDGRFVLGSLFSGMIDEFRIYSLCLESPALTKFPLEGGRMETKTLDLGGRRSRVLKIEALGGRISGGNRGGLSPPESVYAGNSGLRFADYSEIQFFVRAGNAPYSWDGVPWIPVEPGVEPAESVSGRYVQAAAVFYPSGDGESTPYLDELRIVYLSAEPPLPPSQLTAAARNGAVELSWRASPGRDVGGYLVYYGTSSGEYFGDPSAAEGGAVKPPVDVGNRTALRIEGLKNGRLYYFAVAAYSAADSERHEPGGFSREAAARPLPEASPGPAGAEGARKVE